MNDKTKTKPKADPTAITLVTSEAGKERSMAKLVLRPCVQSAATIKAYNSTDDNINVNALIAELDEQAEAIHGGDLSRIESMLTSQAHTLDALFGEFAKRSKLNAGQYMDAADCYMRLGLKAQSQCRATLETLAAIKNPPVVFAKQANISQGHQQVNNTVNVADKSTQSNTHAHAKNHKTLKNELLEDRQHEAERVDIGATGQTSRGNPAMETVEASHGATNKRGQRTLKQERL